MWIYKSVRPQISSSKVTCIRNLEHVRKNGYNLVNLLFNISFYLRNIGNIKLRQYTLLHKKSLQNLKFCFFNVILASCETTAFWLPGRVFFSSFSVLIQYFHWATLNVMRGLVYKEKSHLFVTPTKNDHFYYPPPLSAT